MAVILDIEKPKDCKECPFMGTDGIGTLSPMMCTAIWGRSHEVKHCIQGKIRDDCPLKEVNDNSVLEGIKAEIMAEIISHSGTGEEVIQAYVDGLHKSIEFIDKYISGKDEAYWLEYERLKKDEFVNLKEAIEAIKHAPVNFSIESDIDFSKYKKEIQLIICNIISAQEVAIRKLDKIAVKVGKDA